MTLFEKIKNNNRYYKHIINHISKEENGHYTNKNKSINWEIDYVNNIELYLREEESAIKEYLIKNGFPNGVLVYVINYSFGIKKTVMLHYSLSS